MSLEQDVSQVEQNVVSAVESSDEDTSTKLIEDVNQDLSTYGQSVRDYIESSLATEGLLPDIAMKTGLVSEDEYITKDKLQEVSDQEGNTSLKGMAARYLVEHYGAIGSGRNDINSDYVKGFDLRLDMAMDTARTMREFPGLLQLAKDLPSADKDAADGLTREEIDTLLKTPDNLSEDQRDSLTYMKSWFDIMKTPRGIWTIADRSTQRVTAESLDEFVDTSVPLGFRKQLDIVQRDYEQEQGYKIAAQANAGQPDQLEPPKIDDKSPAANLDTDDGDDGDPKREVPELVKPDPQDSIPEIPEHPTKPNQAQVDTLPNLEIDEKPGQPDLEGKHPENGGRSDGQDKEGDNRIGPDSQLYQESRDLDDNPDAFGPNRRLFSDTEPQLEVKRESRFLRFGEEEETGDKSKEADEKTEKEEEPKTKTIKLKQNATVEDLARTQLPDDASDEQVKEMSDKIRSLNDSLQAPGASIEAGKEIKVPEDFELGTPVDKTYIVEKGDNLWNISKAHLKELNGTKPSNKEILDMVNKIVERNKIPNPDLIYPDQKIFIPGEAPEEVEPPEPPKPPEEEESDERKKLLEEAKDSFGDEPDKLEKFKEDMDRFEERAEKDGLSQEEVDNTYKEVRRLLEAEGDTPLNEEQREKLAQQVLFQAANPNKIDQGQRSTCNMNSVEVRTYTRDPSKAAKLVTDVALTGEFTGTDGIKVKVDATPHNDSKNDVRYESRRSHASEIFQVTAVNLHLEMENRKTTPPGQLRYEEYEKVPGDPETERVVDYSQTPPKVVDDHPQVYTSNVGKMRDVYNSVTGKSETEIVLGHEKYVTDRSDAVKRIDSEESLHEYLRQAKADGKFPILLTVHTGNEPFWTDSGRGSAGGSGGGHIVTITDFQDGPEPKVTIDNSWGSGVDHDASNPVSLDELYRTMQRPRDSVEILKTDVAEARDAGNPDYFNEFDIHRLERSLGRLNQEQFADKLIETMDKAKEDWGAGRGTESKVRAMMKLADLIRSLPTDQKNRVQAHKDSIGLS